MESKDLTRSQTWEKLGSDINREFSAGVPFADILAMNVAIKQRDLAPYEAHRKRLDGLFADWHEGHPQIVDLGAGYGAMATFWPEGSRVFNVDLPEMLNVQASYLKDIGWESLPDGKVWQGPNDVTVYLIPFTEADAVPWDGAYLFSAWALTETTPATWAYYIDKAPRLAAAYVLGHRSWERGDPWPWAQLADAFDHSQLAPAPMHADSMEFAGANEKYVRIDS